MYVFKKGRTWYQNIPHLDSSQEFKEKAKCCPFLIGIHVANAEARKFC